MVADEIEPSLDGIRRINKNLRPDAWLPGGEREVNEDDDMSGGTQQVLPKKGRGRASG